MDNEHTRATWHEEPISSLDKIEVSLLLEGIYLRYGYDFRNYASASITRRIKHRMELEKIDSISRFQHEVLHSEAMMNKLLQDFSIQVTEMFRDPDFFATFRKEVVPLLHSYPFIRIWHAGCSTGEEAYSMAILLEEEGLYAKSKIYATDMSRMALDKAKKGNFSFDKMKLYTQNYLHAGGTQPFSTYYTANEFGAELKPYLRENIIFAQHNLVTDSSFNEFHVIFCRNVLIYFNKNLQNHVLSLFNKSLVRFGVLGLGQKESLRFTEIDVHFEALNGEQKLYKKMQ